MTNLENLVKKLEFARNVIVMTGAGISTNAGIPDFISKKSGLYNKINMPNPTDIFTLKYFKNNPEPFYEQIFDLFPLITNAKPTIAHYFIKLLNDKNKLLRHYTQNVDSLEDLTGLNKEKIIQCHGNWQSGTCLNCDEDYDFEYMKNYILEKKIPKCNRCNRSQIKPNVVLFGEELNFDFQNSVTEFDACDYLIKMGTSLVVEPFAQPAKVNSFISVLILNIETNKTFLNLGDECYYSQTDCDKGCLEISRLLGWDK